MIGLSLQAMTIHYTHCCTQTHTHTCMHTHMHTHMHKDTHTHTHTHTHTAQEFVFHQILHVRIHIYTLYLLQHAHSTMPMYVFPLMHTLAYATNTYMCYTDDVRYWCTFLEVAYLHKLHWTWQMESSLAPVSKERQQRRASGSHLALPLPSPDAFPLQSSSFETHGFSLQQMQWGGVG